MEYVISKQKKEAERMQIEAEAIKVITRPYLKV